MDSTAQIKVGCRRWLEGHRGELWNEELNSLRRNSPQSTVKATDKDSFNPRAHRAVNLLWEVLLQKACSTLVHEPFALITEAVLQEMMDKPAIPCKNEYDRLSSLRQEGPAAALQVDQEVVEKAIASFAAGSAGGPSGLRPQHLKDALVPGLKDEVLRNNTLVVNVLAKGVAPFKLQNWLCAASLVAFPKPDGSHRPVAVGEVWRRLTSKVLAEICFAEFRELLEPVQVGVGTRGGADTSVHTPRQCLHRNRDDVSKILAALDLENAFNSADRSTFLSSVRQIISGLAPWAHFCYSSPSSLLLSHETLESS